MTPQDLVVAMVDRLIGEEGAKPFLYDDANDLPIRAGSHVVGNPTIGIGWNVAARPMTRVQMKSICGDHVAETIAEVSSLFASWDSLDGVRQMVLIDMAFNLGAGGLAGFHDLRAAVDGEDWTRAKAEMIDSHWHGQVKGRAPPLEEAMLTGVFS